MAVAAQSQKMLQMAAHIVHCGPAGFVQKCSIEIQPRRAAKIADRAELLIRQITHKMCIRDSSSTAFAFSAMNFAALRVFSSSRTESVLTAALTLSLIHI